MRTFGRYLWKEWRDQRVVVMGFLLAIPALIALVAATLPDKVVSDKAFATVTAFGCLAIAALALACEIVPSESRRKTMRFLARMPSGFAPAFRAKACVVLLGLALFPLYGWAIAAMFGSAEYDPVLARWMPHAVVFALWCFAISSWLPRGALALPATALVLGALFFPIYLVWTSNPHLKPVRGAESWMLWILGAGSLVVACWSAVAGRRFDRGPCGSAWRGLAGAAVLFMPGWAYSAVEAYDFHRNVDPASAHWRIESGYLGEGKRYVFLNSTMARRLRPKSRVVGRALIVDLHDGSWRSVGGPNDWFLPVGAPSTMWFDVTRPHPLTAVALRDAVQKPRKGERWMHYYAGGSGAHLKSGWSGMRFDEVEALSPRAPRRVPAGGRYWGLVGIGGRLAYDTGRSGIWDPVRQRRYAIPGDLPRNHYFVLESTWLAKDGATYRRFDPDTKAFAGPPLRRPRWPLDVSRYVHAGTVVDAATGSETTISDWAEYSNSLATTPAGRPVVEFFDGTSFRYGRLDPKTLDVTWARGIHDVAHRDFQLVAVVDEHTLIGIYRHNQLVRVRFGSDEREVLFPR